MVNFEISMWMGVHHIQNITNYLIIRSKIFYHREYRYLNANLEIPPSRLITRDLPIKADDQ